MLHTARGGLVLLAACSSVALLLAAGSLSLSAQTNGKAYTDAAEKYAKDLLKEGKQIFRFDTFGSEEFWAASCGCTTRSRGRSSEVSGRASARRWRWSWASKSTWTPCPRR